VHDADNFAFLATAIGSMLATDSLDSEQHEIGYLQRWFQELSGHYARLGAAWAAASASEGLDKLTDAGFVHRLDNPIDFTPEFGDAVHRAAVDAVASTNGKVLWLGHAPATMEDPFGLWAPVAMNAEAVLLGNPSKGPPIDKKPCHMTPPPAPKAILNNVVVCPVVSTFLLLHKSIKIKLKLRIAPRSCT
jgi:hypothetical protein